jgi:hypothetical protein
VFAGSWGIAPRARRRTCTSTCGRSGGGRRRSGSSNVSVTPHSLTEASLTV